MVGGVVRGTVRQVSVLVCVVLVGTSEGLVSPRVLEGARCRRCGTE